MLRIPVIAKVRELRELQALIDEATAEVEVIKDTIKAHMGTQEELRAGEYKVTWKPITATRFDSGAFKLNRPEFQQMITDSANKSFDAIIVHKLDRFSRDRYDSAFYKRSLKRNGIKLFSVSENLDDSPESIILESVLEGMAEYYSKNLAREVQKGQKENAYQCRHTGGVPPLGYDVDLTTKRLIINPFEAEAVKLIFRRFLNGFSYDDILTELNILGIKGKRGKELGNNSLHSILKNEKYTGTYIYNKSAAKDADGKRNGHAYKPKDEWIIIEDGCPAIISKEDFADVQIVLLKRMQTRKSSRAIETYLLTGKMVCGICGGSYVGSRRARGDKSIYAAYGCNLRYRSDNQCENKEISKTYIEGWIFEQLNCYVFNDYYIPYVTKEYNRYINDKSRKYSGQYQAYTIRLKEIQKDIDKIVTLLLQTNSPTLIKRLDELEADRVQVECALEQLNRDNLCTAFTEKDIKAVFVGIREKLKSGNLKSIKQVIDTYINQIVIYPNEARIQFNFFPELSVKFDEGIEKDRPITEGLQQLRGQSNSLDTNINADEFGGEGGI